MQKSFIPVAFMLLALTSACKKDSGGTKYILEYNKSYDRWLQFKDSCNNSYEYKVATSSWAGFGTETIITVQDGAVVERSIMRWQAVYTGNTYNIDTTDLWIETGAQIGTTDRGFSPITLDEVYDEAKNNWLQKRDNASTYFHANNNGMLSSCGYVKDGCADDCSVGINIRYIRPL